jgi:hypothetical protein
VVQWDTGVYDGVRYHRIWNPSQTVFQEISDQANWGTMFLGTKQDSAVSGTAVEHIK